MKLNTKNSHKQKKALRIIHLYIHLYTKGEARKYILGFLSIIFSTINEHEAMVDQIDYFNNAQDNV